MINFNKYKLFFKNNRLFSLIQTIEPQSNNNVAAASNNYGSFSSVRDDYERGDIALGDVKKQSNVNADYGVLPVNDGYTALPFGNDGYGVMPTSSN